MSYRDFRELHFLAETCSIIGDGFEVKVDGLPDIGKRFLARIAFADAAGQYRGEYRVSTLAARFQDYL